MSRKRKMSASEEEQPSSSRPAIIIVSHRNNEDEAATIPTLPVTAVTTAPSVIGNVTSDADIQAIGPIATTGRPHTAPVKMEDSEEMDAQNQMVPCDKTTGMDGGIGCRSQTLKGGIGRNDTLLVLPKPTKKTTKRSRILTSADDDGIVVVGGRGGRGQSVYVCNSGGHGSSTNALASSYYLYHGHRHTNDARSSSSLDSFHDCLSTSHKEKKEDGNGRANKVRGDHLLVFCSVLMLHAYMYYFALDLTSAHENSDLFRLTYRYTCMCTEHSRHQLQPFVLHVR